MSLQRFRADERGATAIEYALIGGLIGLVLIAAIGLIGTNLKGVFESVSAGFPT